MLHFDAGEGCGFQGCAIDDLEHFHCKDDGCETVFRKGDEHREHGRNHFIQDYVSLKKKNLFNDNFSYEVR